MADNKLDGNDRKILELLKQDAKLTTRQLAEKTLLPATTVHNRIKKLEKTGIIRNYTIVTDNKKLGKPLSAYILMTIDYKFLRAKEAVGEKGRQEHELAKMLKRHPLVEEVDMVTGTHDMIIRISAKGIEELNEFVTNFLVNIEGIEKTQTMIVLSSF